MSDKTFARSSLEMVLSKKHLLCLILTIFSIAGCSERHKPFDSAEWKQDHNARKPMVHSLLHHLRIERGRDLHEVHQLLGEPDVDLTLTPDSSEQFSIGYSLNSNCRWILTHDMSPQKILKVDFEKNSGKLASAEQVTISYPTEDYSIGIKNSAPSAKLLNNMDKSSVDDLVGTTSVEAYGGKLKCLAPCFFDDDVESVLNVEADKIVRSKMPDLNAWSAITLKNGKILVVGGRKKDNLQNTVWLLSKDRILPGPTLSNARLHAGLTLLPNDRVLVSGGQQIVKVRDEIQLPITINSTEIIDLKTGKCLPSAAMKIPRYHHTGYQLKNGNIILGGGCVPRQQTDDYENATPLFELLSSPDNKSALVRVIPASHMTMASNSTSALICCLVHFHRLQSDRQHIECFDCEKLLSSNKRRVSPENDR